MSMEGIQRFSVDVTECEGTDCGHKFQVYPSLQSFSRPAQFQGSRWSQFPCLLDYGRYCDPNCMYTIHTDH